MREGTTLVFVEVKLRRGTGFGGPLEAVTTRKQNTLRSLAKRYLSEREPTFDAVRFDVVGIIAGTTNNRFQHVEDAF